MSLKFSSPVLSTTTEIGSVICSSYLLFRPLPGGGLKITDRVPGDLRRDIATHKADVTGRDVRQAGLLMEPPGSGFET